MPAGPETRRWADGKCMIYDTTFEHETFNESTDQERVKLLKYWEPRIDTKPLN